MRRLLVAAALGTAVLAAAGCSTDKSGEAAPAAPDPAAGTAAPAPAPGGSVAADSTPGGAGTSAHGGDAALAGNTAAVCNQAAKTGGQFGALFAQDLKLLIDAESAKDADQAAEAKQKTAQDIQNYSFALADMSKLVADPTVKQALADMSRQVTGLNGDLRKFDDKAAGELQATLDKACRT